MNKYIYKTVLSILLLISTNTSAQIIDSTWAPISYQEKLVYIDLSEISSFTGEEIFVWTMENHSEPLIIESMEKDVYKTKTYYLLNKKLRKYSLKEVIYLDEDNNVLEDFTYDAISNDPEYRYSYPIFDGSLADLILQRCIREIESKSK